jgi:hypothetical protein
MVKGPIEASSVESTSFRVVPRAFEDLLARPVTDSPSSESVDARQGNIAWKGVRLNVRQERGYYGACDFTLPETLCKTKSLPLYWDPSLHRPSRDTKGQWLQQTKQDKISIRRSNCRTAQGFHVSLGRVLEQQAGTEEKPSSTAQWM